jgi:hypothetical protein
MTSPGARLRALLANPLLVMPGAYDALSARLIEREGFSAVMAGGFAAAGTLLAETRSDYPNAVVAIAIPAHTSDRLTRGLLKRLLRTCKRPQNTAVRYDIGRQFRLISCTDRIHPHPK